MAECRRLTRLLMAFGACFLPSLSSAGAWAPEGSWLASNRVAIEVFDCSSMLCGKIVWLRNPALRTPTMCGRTIVWNLQPSGQSEWTGGWFFDPEDGNTYNINATLESDTTISARIYQSFAFLGKTEILRRIPTRSLDGWC